MTERLIGSPVRRMVLDLLDDLEDMADIRHSSVNEFRQHALDNWRIYRTNFRIWRQKAKAEICKLREMGSPGEADWLAEQLRKHRDTHNPEEFRVDILPQDGRRETWQLTGGIDPPCPKDSSPRWPDNNSFAEVQSAAPSPDPLRHQNGNELPCRPSATETILSSMDQNVTASSRMPEPAHEVDNCATANEVQDSGCSDTSGQLRIEAQASTVAVGQIPPNIQQSIPVLSRIQRTAALIDVEVDTFGRGIITFSQAREHKLWIGHNHSEKAFCLTCPCPLMVAPTGTEFPDTASEGTHHFVPLCFHLDSFNNDAALRHFRNVHNETFLDMGGMLRKYGSEIQTEDIRLDPLAIAAHNMLVQLWQESFSADLREAESKMLQQCQKADYLVSSKPRSIKRSEVPANNFVFSRPESHEDWIVYCPIPTCSEPNFVDDPLHDNAAIRHFQKHGMQLNDSQIINIFGLKVIHDPKNTIIVNIQREGGSVNGLEHIPSATAQDEDQSVSPEAGVVRRHPRKARPIVEGKKYSPWIAGEQMIQYEGVKVERITGRRLRKRGHASWTEYKLHFADCHKGKWVTISKLDELREIVESFDRGNGEETPWLAKQKFKVSR